MTPSPKIDSPGPAPRPLLGPVCIPSQAPKGVPVVQDACVLRRDPEPPVAPAWPLAHRLSLALPRSAVGALQQAQQSLPPATGVLATSLWAATGQLAPQVQQACSPALNVLLGAGALYGAAMACGPGPALQNRVHAEAKALWAGAVRGGYVSSLPQARIAPDALPRLQHIGLAHMQNRLNQEANAAAAQEAEAYRAIPWFHRRLGNAAVRMMVPAAAAGTVCLITATLPMLSLLLAGLTFVATHLLLQDQDPLPPEERSPKKPPTPVTVRRPRFMAAAAARKQAIYRREWATLAAITERADDKATPLLGLVQALRRVRATLAQEKAELNGRRTPSNVAVRSGTAKWATSAAAGTLAMVGAVAWPKVSTLMRGTLYALSGPLMLFPLTGVLGTLVQKWASALDSHEQRLADAVALLEEEDNAWHNIEQQYLALARETQTKLPPDSIWQRLSDLFNTAA
jgi:hypothetical protein